MSLRIIHIFQAIFILAGVTAQNYFDDYYHDYDAEYEEPKFDLEALVSAWRDYVKDKKSEETTTLQTPETPNLTKCDPRENSYRIPDELQCDKYYECNIKGELKEALCPDGLVFDVKSERCDYPAKVVCLSRTKLQTPMPTKNCPRQNGFFAWASNESCQKFWDCREGIAYLQTCPGGVIFDPKVDACVTPDQSARKECSDGKFLGFQCPKYDSEQVLRFGNHERLPHPKDCQQFFSCLRDGKARLGACPKKTVFNNETGHCGDPSNVPGCENFWESKNDTDYDYYF